jgi:hypothetical protein
MLSSARACWRPFAGFDSAMTLEMTLAAKYLLSLLQEILGGLSDAPPSSIPENNQLGRTDGAESTSICRAAYFVLR